MRFTHWGFPIRTPPDQRLLATSPKFIAGTPRPSSLLKAKASTIRPYFHLPRSTHISLLVDWYSSRRIVFKPDAP